MAEHQAVEIDKMELKRAEDMWCNFIKLSKRFTVFTVAVLVLLGLIFI